MTLFLSDQLHTAFLAFIFLSSRGLTFRLQIQTLSQPPFKKLSH
uniref:Uncharacterized protein n=1 Tax=Anguilla anguilla TaxID=7936 RepID=A0A0E9XNI4_ANGAN